MDLASKILEIRKNGGLTQEELAEKLFVTRQAVSRWENGETSPTIETLKKICELFKVDANAFFGQQPPVCQSCGMPLKSFDEFSVNEDNTANIDYCKYCFNEGKFSSESTVDEMIEINLKYLDHFNKESGTNFSEEESRKILKQYLPTLKRWKENKV